MQLCVFVFIFMNMWWLVCCCCCCPLIGVLAFCIVMNENNCWKILDPNHKGVSLSRYTHKKNIDQKSSQLVDCWMPHATQPTYICIISFAPGLNELNNWMYASAAAIEREWHLIKMQPEIWCEHRDIRRDWKPMPIRWLVQLIAPSDKRLRRSTNLFFPCKSQIDMFSLWFRNFLRTHW